jgi:hypothetical protein
MTNLTAQYVMTLLLDYRVHKSLTSATSCLIDGSNKMIVHFTNTIQAKRLLDVLQSRGIHVEYREPTCIDPTSLHIMFCNMGCCPGRVDIQFSDGNPDWDTTDAITPEELLREYYQRADDTGGEYPVGHGASDEVPAMPEEETVREPEDWVVPLSEGDVRTQGEGTYDRDWVRRYNRFLDEFAQQQRGQATPIPIGDIWQSGTEG